MAIILCDITAREFWFGDQRVVWDVPAAALLDAAPGAVASSRLPEEELFRLGILSRPVHLLVTEHRLQRSSASVASHLWAPPHPPGTFARLSKSVYMLGPAACLVQMASGMSDVELLTDLYKACGTYRTFGGELFERRPLQRRERLLAYVDSVRGRRGIRRLRALGAYVLEGSASPLETKAALTLVLPESMGGYGLPLPVLNRRVLVGACGRGEVRRPDMLWPERRVVVEVLGERFHGSPSRIGPDAARKTHLQKAGYAVFDLTAHQLGSRVEMDAFVTVLRDQLDLGSWRPVVGWAERNEALRRQLFGDAPRSAGTLKSNS